MIHKLKKWLLLLFGCLSFIVIGYMVFMRFSRPISHTLPAKIEEIKQAVKLSTLDITTEEIFRDTVNIKGVVSRVKARVYIHFDIEHIPMAERGDTLFVQLPPEIIDIYESTTDGSQILDVWNLQFPNEPVDTPLSTHEENLIKRKYKQRIEEQMYEKGYVKQARENALHSLVILFSRFRDNVVIIDHHPDGWRNVEQPVVFSETPPTITD